ncbi:MAG: cysteine--tRNA ligase [Clostridiales bacterium]|nr:cysteine--tRNA ligase [Clostridiales bacterium]
MAGNAAPLRLYNTLSRQKEDFRPLNEGIVGIYSCGPTVYNFAHIGNLRTYVFMDLLGRVLEHCGYKLNHVMNITDVGHLVSDADEGEDKMQKTAREQQKSPWEIAVYFTGVFFNDISELNIRKPDNIPKATDHVQEMIEYVEGLLKKGYAYETSDGIYFDISKFEGYGKLSRINLDEQMAGARVEVNDEKRNPADFALWKRAPKEHIMQWPSPWGMGFPGWHIECSAMSRKYLGDVFDIHTGGVDHIPIHHENEIAQSEGFLGKPAVNYWMHAEFLLVDGGKMSKSLGNTYTVALLREKGFNPLAYRYFCLNAHYKSKLNFTWEGLKSAQVSLERLYEAAAGHAVVVRDAKSSTIAGDAPESVIYDQYIEEFNEAVCDDLNVPKALGVVWTAVRQKTKSSEIYRFILDADSILGVDIGKNVEKILKIRQMSKENASAITSDEPDKPEDPEIISLIEQRNKARKEKNWKLADEIRDTLKSRGVSLEDAPEGVKWKRIL